MTRRPRTVGVRSARVVLAALVTLLFALPLQAQPRPPAAAASPAATPRPGAAASTNRPAQAPKPVAAPASTPASVPEFKKAKREK